MKRTDKNRCIAVRLKPAKDEYKINLGGTGMKKRIAALLILWACLLSLFAGCNGETRVEDWKDLDREITTITFFGNKYEPENVAVIEQIISGFMAENPEIRVSYESLKGKAYYDALTKRMASGKGNDVFMVDHDVLLELEQTGQVVDLSGLSTISEYTDQMRSQMDKDGKIYWVPTTVSVFGLYCNMDLLEEQNQEIPSNLEEWEAVCNAFRQKGYTPVIANNDISLKTLAIGRGFYSAYQENRQAEFFSLLNSGEKALGDALYSGFSIAEAFIQKGYIDADQALRTKKTSDDLQEFVKGESPFLLTGAWAAGRVKEMQPDFDFKVVPLPVLEDGSLLVVNPDTRLSVNADSDHLDAAIKFVEYFTKAENIQKLADQQSSFSPLQSGNPPSLQEIQPLIACYRDGRTVIGADTFLDLPIWELTAQASEKLLAGEPLEMVMEWIDRQVEEDRLS